ncbi:MAG TPA: substrate-binding domain-containing protein [Devosia sp.]|jgi:L-arabinose transport system substrate-binding protein|nr:substrate-binding domain-containing protein [Devosia sp.]
MPASRARKGILSVAGLVIGATALAAGTVAAPAADKPIVGFITQLSQQQYFVDEANGAQKIADQLGAQLIVVDSGLDSDKVMSLASSLATQGAKAIVVVPSNTDVGPALSDIANQNHMFLVASDSPLKDSAGKPVPFVGMDNTGAGKQVGDIIVREFPKTGWDPKDTFFADIEAPFQACLDRTDTALKAFQDANPGWPAGNLVKVPYKGLIDQADDAMRAALTAHPEAKHWILESCNDEGVVGALQALDARDFPVKDVLGVGLGATQACLAFTSDYIKDGFKATTDLDPGAIGGGAVQVAVDLINGKTVPPTTYVPTPELTIDNFKDKLNCK